MRQVSVKLELAENMQKDVQILLPKNATSTDWTCEDTQIAIIKHCVVRPLKSDAVSSRT